MPAALRRVLTEVEALRDVPLGDLTISRVELVVTDVVVSPRHVRTLATIELT